MIQSRSDILKQVLCGVWAVLTVFIWLAVNLPESRMFRSFPVISQTMVKTRKVVWPYIYRQYIFAEKKPANEAGSR